MSSIKSTIENVIENPDSVRSLNAEEIRKIIRFALPVLASEPALIRVQKSRKETEIIFAGDTHGDFETTKRIAARFLEVSDDCILVFLGDYIDRAPEPDWAIYNLLYLLALKCVFPQNVFLLKGNHETNYAIPCWPYDFKDDLRRMFGADGIGLHDEFVDVFREMPLMLKTENGIFASHAGFARAIPSSSARQSSAGEASTRMRGIALHICAPKVRTYLRFLGKRKHSEQVHPAQNPRRRRNIEKSSELLLMDVVWADPEISGTYRDAGIPRFNEIQLHNFLESAGCKVLIRGHDYHTMGKAIYGSRCLTISSSRRYAQFGGVLLARARLDRDIENALDIIVEDVSSGVWKPFKVKVL